MILKLYQRLYKEYGAQGWWPFIGIGYHPKDYSYPKNENQIFEVALGSILTQNTTFISVEKALQNLQNIDALTPQAIQNLEEKKLKEAIKPAGYFNQKARYILNFIQLFEELNGKIPSREKLLGVKGIGEETADSILLYGYNEPQFKVDAYTKRLLIHLGVIEQKTKYKEIKNKEKLVQTYQEFHALIVQHGKNHYSKKPYGIGCFCKL